MPRFKNILIAFSIITAVEASAITTDSLRTTIARDFCGLWQINSDAYSGPTTTALRSAGSITRVQAQSEYLSSLTSYQGWEQSNTLSIGAGASTRTRTQGGIVTGSADYRYSSVEKLNGSETLEAALLYPYLTIDSIGGALQSETYRFSGSYSNRIGHLSLGVGGEYRASLEYRDIDPRPRNITGDLDVHFGALYPFIPTMGLGVDLRVGRYRHSSQISFVNPLGATEILHKTGPESHYVRFAGNGLSTLYSGYNYGASLSLLPISQNIGLTALASVDYNTLTKQLVDLNRLPLTRSIMAKHRALIAWTLKNRGFSFMPYSHWEYDRIRGRENIFGDPASGVYPMISSIEMYGNSIERIYGGVATHWESKGGTNLLIDCRCGKLSFREMYRLPAYNLSYNSLEWECALKTATPLGRGLITTNLSYGNEWGNNFSLIASNVNWPISRDMLAEISAKLKKLPNGNNFIASIAINF